LRAHVARRSYPFSAKTIQKRLSFAEGYKNWTEQDWEKVSYEYLLCFKYS